MAIKLWVTSILKKIKLYTFAKKVFTGCKHFFGQDSDVLKIYEDKNLWVAKSGTIFQPGFSITPHVPVNSPRVFIGENCVLGCSITLEREVGDVCIGDNTFIGHSSIICASGINIGSDVLMAWGITIVDHDSHSVIWAERSSDVRDWRDGLINGGVAGAASKKNWDVVNKSSVKIGNKVWIGFNVIILKGVEVGEGVVIAAGSVVTKNVAPWTLVGGNPARFIKNLPKTEEN